ncbi:hypothetical protein [Streptomyces poonensis]|uniref:Uncharacterized protein n=1 Tax=Streptomyces poonensis TaxID=68255 RepID=A0A918QAH8_9ACTN|nr:hypothetical protein [Streptomyces poonensis]GGZ39240.1 hypothetical protein GCM10010365_69990 [Streptomyces poonensis]GLJ93109.1 hypothetical protein GCM10017589_57210 [Streptomyces poonensis]
MNSGEHRENAMSGGAPAPYATDGTDFRGVLKYHYGIALKRFAKIGLPCAVMVVQMYLWPMDYRGYLLPVAVVGFIGLVFSSVLFYARTSMIWRCSRIFRTYPLAYRGSLEKVKHESRRLHLRFGKQTGHAVTMLAKDPLQRAGWLNHVVDGVWFAGDDPFGGAAIVPGTGELLFMQPSEWNLSAAERDSAGEVRIKQAKRAGIKRPVG